MGLPLSGHFGNRRIGIKHENNSQPRDCALVLCLCFQFRILDNSIAYHTFWKFSFSYLIIS